MGKRWKMGVNVASGGGVVEFEERFRRTGGEKPDLHKKA